MYTQLATCYMPVTRDATPPGPASCQYLEAHTCCTAAAADRRTNPHACPAQLHDSHGHRLVPVTQEAVSPHAAAIPVSVKYCCSTVQCVDCSCLMPDAASSAPIWPAAVCNTAHQPRRPPSSPTPTAACTTRTGTPLCMSGPQLLTWALHTLMQGAASWLTTHAWHGSRRPADIDNGCRRSPTNGWLQRQQWCWSTP
jgi:hypothetical protein